MKKVLSLILVAAVIATLCIALVACGEQETTTNVNEIVIPTYAVDFPAGFKFGLITLHDDASTYDKNFIDAAYAAAELVGLPKDQVIIRTGVEEGAACTTVANELVSQGCKVIMADSFGHESFLKAAADAHPDVQFCHATGYQAAIWNQANFHNAFASIYEGRYLAGIAAGMKMKADIEAGKYTAAQAKMGYVGAYTYAEVISGLTSYYLGAKSVVPEVTMDVKFTGSWYDPTAEKEAAEALIASGVKLMSQHADSMGAPSACEAAGIPDVSYNGSTITACPNTFIVSSRIDWSYYMAMIIACTAMGEQIPTNFTGDLMDGSVKLTALNGNVVDLKVANAIAKARQELVTGQRYVFDCANFTVNGQHLTEYFINNQKDDQGNVIERSGTNVIKTTPGANAITYFDESGDGIQSAPYFDIQIDGINFLNRVY